ncbi:1-deoxy-D-xylulose-5-phosphate synthase [Peptacetobacter hominis]|uniref:1-deoxy-D-xylulose-5-phosphate synthase n=1 Tax=Peptacetobacter hominis TaxID=2743610 RepID=A0A544QWC4_9FIRM|nr:1-deoxy-D-xylulose-5-phosphate synthase [Peptacetobacter hominis]TQQ84981.1 1-deoxy-D-xylulose-5-phosphate synthase [Peptacetobacter hominis]
MNQNYKILDKVDYPSDLKKLSIEDMNILSEEIRDVLIDKLSKTGGHVGPNLGIVEATIAMHYVFNSPKDKIVFDVSHQCYTHKILTGRKYGFTDPEKYNSISGFTSKYESNHDIFSVGHTSTSVSLACGLVKARDLKGEKHNVIAVIGDGSLSGGEALEGLNNAAELNSNLIIIFNDNDMSIAENQGGIYKNLKMLRETDGKSECNIFKSFGLDYTFVKDGNDIESMINVLEKVKDTDRPVVVHICTQKGKGLEFAEVEKEKWHFNSPFDRKTGKPLNISNEENYASITEKYILEKMKNDSSVIAITPATPMTSGFTKKVRSFENQFTDTGIAEEHAVAYASGLASAGAKPVLGIHSSFIQRAYDQISQDLALNRNPAVILVFGGGISGADKTHLGIFDIALLGSIPEIVHMAPATVEEYISMCDWAIEQDKYPVVIRVPSKVIHMEDSEFVFTGINKSKVIKEGNKVCIVAVGSTIELGEKISEELDRRYNMSTTIVNPVYINGIDNELMNCIKENHELVVTLEEGVLEGGYGEKVAAYFSKDNIKVLNFGAKRRFTDRVPAEKLYQEYHMTPELTANDIAEILNLK